MKLSSKIFTGLTALFVGAATTLAVFSGSASADCFQYSANGFNTSNTPVFNNICGVPTLGNESNFVRIRQSSTTTATPTNDETVGPTYNIGTINEACNSGDLFDVWNYLHNDATANQNPDVGSGSAVAHNVVSNLSAPLGTTANSFKFSDTVTSSNAATVSDSATLNCGNKEVQLSLVPGSVHTLTAPTGSYNDIADSSINSPLTLGNPTWGSGDVWGCWNYRILIIYEVKVTVIPPTVVQPTCNLLTLESSGQVAKVEGLDFTAGSSTVNGATIEFFNGNNLVNTANLTTTEIQNLSKTSPLLYTFASPGNFTVKATVNTSLGNVTSANCVGTFTASTPPVTPPSTPVTPASTTTLVNTGPGSVAALFASAVAVGTGAYYWFIRRHLANK